MPLIQDGKIIRTYEEQVQHLTDKHREQEEINKNIQEENSNINDKLDEIDKKIPDIDEALNTANEAIQKATAEETRAKKAENDLTNKLQVVEGNVTVAGNAASSALTKISEEETRAQNVESVLSRQIVQEGVSRGQVYTELQQEIERAKSREDEIDADLSTEILDRTNEDADLRTDIDKNAGDINDIRKLPYIAVSSNKFSDNGLTSYLIPLSDISPISPAPIVGSVVFFQTDISSYIGVVSELQSSAVSVVAKQKLGGEGGSVTPYILPVATKSRLGGVKSSDKGTDGTDYKVHVNDDGTMVVNVPTSGGGGGQSSEDDFYVHNILLTNRQEYEYYLSFSFINKYSSFYTNFEDLFNAFFGSTEVILPATGAYRQGDTGRICPIVCITTHINGFKIAFVENENNILSSFIQSYSENQPIITDYCYEISISTASSGSGAQLPELGENEIFFNNSSVSAISKTKIVQYTKKTVAFRSPSDNFYFVVDFDTTIVPNGQNAVGEINFFPTSTTDLTLDEFIDNFEGKAFSIGATNATRTYSARGKYGNDEVVTLEIMLLMGQVVMLNVYCLSALGFVLHNLLQLENKDTVYVEKTGGLGNTFFVISGNEFN